MSAPQTGTFATKVGRAPGLFWTGGGAWLGRGGVSTLQAGGGGLPRPPGQLVSVAPAGRWASSCTLLRRQTADLERLSRTGRSRTPDDAGRRGWRSGWRGGGLASEWALGRRSAGSAGFSERSSTACDDSRRFVRVPAGGAGADAQGGRHHGRDERGGGEDCGGGRGRRGDGARARPRRHPEAG